VALPRGWLQTVRRTGLPISPLAHGLVRPQRLMLEVLEHELRLEPTRAQTMYTRAAELAAQRHETLRAVTYYLKAQRFEEAVHLVSATVSHALAKWEPQAVRHLLEALPTEHLSAPLKAALGQALLDTGEPDRGEALLRGVVTSGQADHATYYGLALLAARRSKHDQQLEWLEQALAMPIATEQERKLLRLKASAYAGLGRFEEALRLALECASKAELAGDLLETAAAFDVAEYVYGSLGRSVERERAIKRAIELFTALDMPLRTMSLKSNLAELCVNTGRFEEAETHLHDALTTAQREDHPAQITALETRGDAQFLQLQFAEAVTTFETTLALCQRFGREGVAVRLLLKLADANRQLGHDQHADALLERAAAHGIPEAAVTLQAHHLFAQGQSLFAKGEFTAAEDHFERTQTLPADPNTSLRAQLFLTELQLRRGDSQPALAQRLKNQCLVSANQRLYQLDIHALSQVRAHLFDASMQLEPAPIPSASVISAKPKLNIRSIGGFEVRIDNQPIAVPIAKSAELLVWLALHGRARRDTIIDAIWDGSNERRHAEYFRFAVRRLRSSLSEHPAVTFNPVPFETEYYQIADQFEIELDALTISQPLEPANYATVERTLLQLQGQFMSTLESEWAEMWRSKCEEQFKRLILQMVEPLNLEAPMRAITLCERLIERDPFDEEIQVLAIRLCQVSGDHRSAARILSKYQSVLRRELGEDLPPNFLGMIQADGEIKQYLTGPGQRADF
jgi:LuxR family transcriptional regulator, maltose regulon positive regulatory protein